jgi:hypothetical protein
MIYGDRVQETTTTSGTGTISLVGATDGHISFVNGVGTGNSCLYLITTDTAWEIGKGTVTDATPDTLTRSVRKSSNSNNLINLAGGLNQFVSQIIDASIFNSFGWEIVTTATSITAQPGQFVVVTAGSKTITLPASPIIGYCVKIGVGAFTTTVVARNASNIMSLAEDLTIDTASTTIILQYVDATIGWKLA